MSKPSISIRVKLPDEKEQTFEEGEVVTILWDRVIAAALLATLMLGLLLLGLQYWRSMESLETPVKLHPNTPIKQSLTDTSKSKTAPTESAGAESNSNSPSGVQNTQQTELANQLSHSENPATHSGSEAKPIVDTQTPALKQSSATHEQQADATIAENTNLSSGEKELTIATKQAATKAAQTPQAPKATNSHTAPLRSGQMKDFNADAASVSVYSQSILQARLTTELDNRIPQSDAPSILRVDNSALLTVYFFTEIKGFRATPVFFDWYRNDIRVARVRIRPKYDTTPILSSKYINQNMSGDWRVELLSEEGKTLAASQFRVIRQQSDGVAHAGPR